jgi:hypothetical protein
MDPLKAIQTYWRNLVSALSDAVAVIQNGDVSDWSIEYEEDFFSVSHESWCPAGSQQRASVKCRFELNTITVERKLKHTGGLHPLPRDVRYEDITYRIRSDRVVESPDGEVESYAPFLCYPDGKELQIKHVIDEILAPFKAG